MKEDFLHYIWKYKKINISKLKTTEGENITIHKTGIQNDLAGPDFFNALVRIDKQLWAGNIEIHIKSSDWYAHHHEKDTAYDNVILHIVWEYDVPIYRRDKTEIPTLVLKDIVDKTIYDNYLQLLEYKKVKWIYCESQLDEIPLITLSNWKERLYFERLEQKGRLIEKLLSKTNNDWEAVCFKMMMKNFGLKINGEAFLSIAQTIPFSLIRKYNNNPIQLEALLLGQSKLLPEEGQEHYVKELIEEYSYLKNKHQLKNENVIPVQFFRLRPANFPTIRITQLAALYHKYQNLFDKVIQNNTIEEYYNMFMISTARYWDTHYTLEKPTPIKKKRLTKNFIDLLLINTIIPLKFYYAKKHKMTIDDEIITLLRKIDSEKNTIIDKFIANGIAVNNALDSQGLLQLKNEYCDHKKCLQCAIGNYLLQKK
ncbi:DUF2851 family protein [Aquimarina rhabdastrellae]